MSPKCTIDDRFFGKSGDRRIRCTRQPEKRKRNAFPQAPRFVKRVPPETKEAPAAKTASRAGSQSHLCYRLAEQVCLRERWAFSRRTLLLRAPIQVEQALPKQPLGQAEENSVRTASRAGSQSLNATDLLRKSAYENAGRSRAGLCSCARRYKLNKPCQNSPSGKPRGCFGRDSWTRTSACRSQSPVP